MSEDKVPPIHLEFKTLRDLVDRLETLSDDLLDKQAQIYIPDGLIEDHYKMGLLIVPTDGEKLGHPTLYISDQQE